MKTMTDKDWAQLVAMVEAGIQIPEVDPESYFESNGE